MTTVSSMAVGGSNPSFEGSWVDDVGIVWQRRGNPLPIVQVAWHRGPVDAGEARRLLVETLISWSVDAASSTEVVRAAAVAVAEGVDAPWVVGLACLPPVPAANDVEDVLDSSPPDLDVPVLPRGNPEVVLAAAMVLVRRCRAGHMTERDLARWAHDVIGHDRSAELEPLVCLDDSYDIAEYFGDSIEAVDDRVLAEVERLAGNTAERRP